MGVLFPLTFFSIFLRFNWVTLTSSLILFWIRYRKIKGPFLDGEVDSGHEDLNVLPDEGVIFLDDDLVQYQVKH
jgi:hypothetical protein